MLNSMKIVSVELGFQRCKYACPLLKRLTQQNMHTRVTYRWCIRWAIETFLKQIILQTDIKTHTGKHSNKVWWDFLPFSQCFKFVHHHTYFHSILCFISQENYLNSTFLAYNWAARGDILFGKSQVKREIPSQNCSISFLFVFMTIVSTVKMTSPYLI